MYVCGKCHIALNREQLGVTIIEMFGRPPDAYKLWSADVLRCPLCNQETVQSAQEPYAEHWQPRFAEKLNDAISGKFYYAFERLSDAEEYANEEE